MNSDKVNMRRVMFLTFAALAVSMALADAQLTGRLIAIEKTAKIFEPNSTNDSIEHQPVIGSVSISMVTVIEKNQTIAEPAQTNSSNTEGAGGQDARLRAEQKTETIRSALGITKEQHVDRVQAERLIELREKNREKFEAVTLIAKDADVQEKEKLAGELSTMDSGFIQKAAANKEKIQKQAASLAIKPKASIEVKLVKQNKAEIKDFFEKRLTQDELIERIWQNI